MKLKNILLTTFAASTLAMGISSCGSDFLDEKMYSNYPDVDNVNSKLVGLHRQYAGIWGWSGAQGFIACWHFGTDVASPGEAEASSIPFYQYNNLNSENSSVNFLWERLYELINSANQIITSIEGESNPAAKAEAMFFRAYSYNMLVTLWGGVPLIVESTDIPRTDYVRDDVPTVDAQIDSDLTYAIANLPEVGRAVTESRINKDMARQLAAEAYLRMGMRESSYFKKAEDVITPVISGGNYSLVEERYGKFLGESGDYYSDMFRWGNQRRSQGNTEGIWVFQMEYNRNVNGGTIDNPQHRRNWVPAMHKYSGMVNADSLGGRGNGRMRLSNFVKYGLFEKGDIRNSNHNIRRILYYNRPGYSEEIGLDQNGWRVNLKINVNGSDVDNPAVVRKLTVREGDRVIPFVNDSLEVNYPHPTKWGAYDTEDDFGYAMVKDWPLMRLGETYLLRAEARFRQGNADGAADDINVLRNRAFKESRIATGNSNLGRVSASDITLDFILDERVRELISEENRRMTLVRTNMLAQRVARNGDVVPYAPETKVITGFDPSKHLLLPIPLTEIQLNKDANLEQNPYY